MFRSYIDHHQGVLQVHGKVTEVGHRSSPQVRWQHAPLQYALEQQQDITHTAGGACCHHT